MRKIVGAVVFAAVVGVSGSALAAQHVTESGEVSLPEGVEDVSSIADSAIVQKWIPIVVLLLFGGAGLAAFKGNQYAASGMGLLAFGGLVTSAAPKLTSTTIESVEGASLVALPPGFMFSPPDPILTGLVLLAIACVALRHLYARIQRSLVHVA